MTVHTLLCTLPVALLSGLLLQFMRRYSINAAVTVLVLVPVAATLAGVLGVNGWMFTPVLNTELAVGVAVAAVSVPTGLVLGRGIAQELTWQREARARERAAESARRELVTATGARHMDQPRPAHPAGRDPRDDRGTGRPRGDPIRSR